MYLVRCQDVYSVRKLRIGGSCPFCYRCPMESADKPRSLLQTMPPNRAIVLRNATCVYCGKALTPESKTKEHVIGRRFVPKGMFHNRWNLIANACQPCNAAKADLEDDIAAITMLPDLMNRHSGDHETIEAEVRRRGENSVSRRTGKAVKDSREQFSLKGRLMPGVNVSFGFTGPPQIDDRRAFELARLHLTGFFYLQTYKAETQRGGYWLGGYYPVISAARADWGNQVMRAFMDKVAAWDCRLRAVTADGHFKILTRKHPMADCWAWAIEWNHTRRLLGFFGDDSVARDAISQFPSLKMHIVQQGPNKTTRFRTETPLADEDDVLFADDRPALQHAGAEAAS